MKKTNGKAPRQKGDRFEREVVAGLLEGGVFAERIPLSGAAGGSFSGDITLRVGGRDRKGECKSRARAWSDHYKWLRGNDFLFLKKDNSVPLVVMPLETFTALHGEKF